MGNDRHSPGALTRHGAVKPRCTVIVDRYGKRACTRAEGVERLSDTEKGGSPSGAGKPAAHKKAPEDRKGRKQRASDIGRALRTIYDDTLRESVPDDFSDLLGKLS